MTRLLSALLVMTTLIVGIVMPTIAIELTPVSPQAKTATIQQSQLTILRQLASKWGKSFAHSKQWSAAGAPRQCSAYPGVQCDAKGLVTGLSLYGAGIEGSIDGLSGLQALRYLDLGTNGGITVLPKSIASLKLLKHLDVYNCYIEGTIPSFLGNFASLTYLSIGNNPLSGSVPAALGNLKNLVELNIASTGEDGINGTLPTALAKLTNLKALYLRDNRFSGPIPNFLGTLVKLTTLMISKNYWSGPIPASFANLKSLQYLGLRETGISGGIPKFIATLTKLTYLSLSDSTIGGNVPATLNSLVNLKELYLGNADLAGHFPSLAALKKLSVIDISGNYLSGSPPAFISSIKDFNMGDNYFSGKASGFQCPSSDSIASNCLASVPSKCGGAAGQRPAKDCAAFCGTNTKAGVCGGHGICVPDYAKLRRTNYLTPVCFCAKGYKQSGNKKSCVKG
eukprot:TRINITY_DN2538_c0_g2_i7.p1 TRINITY_DN2538_c0_g2~~TRINITY_DN2538_c0_g2_i7.p1  ORF type:complete len:453 (-),score=32.91 TRINITY_DN2538_c0_g2_i7:122-1480(-)